MEKSLELATSFSFSLHINHQDKKGSSARQPLSFLGRLATKVVESRNVFPSVLLLSKRKERYFVLLSFLCLTINLRNEKKLSISKKLLHYWTNRAKYRKGESYSLLLSSNLYSFEDDNLAPRQRSKSTNNFPFLHYQLFHPLHNISQYPLRFWTTYNDVFRPSKSKYTFGNTRPFLGSDMHFGCVLSRQSEPSGIKEFFYNGYNWNGTVFIKLHHHFRTKSTEITGCALRRFIQRFISAQGNANLTFLHSLCYKNLQDMLSSVQLGTLQLNHEPLPTTHNISASRGVVVVLFLFQTVLWFILAIVACCIHCRVRKKRLWT